MSNVHPLYIKIHKVFVVIKSLIPFPQLDTIVFFCAMPLHIFGCGRRPFVGFQVENCVIALVFFLNGNVVHLSILTPPKITQYLRSNGVEAQPAQKEKGKVNERSCRKCA